MRYPLDNIFITGAFREKAVAGTGLPDASGVRRHIGVDLRASVGTAVYAPDNGVVTKSYNGTAGQTIEMRIGDKLWRFMHLSERKVAAGANVSKGQVIGLSGNSGNVAAHLHVDARRDGTLYNASLNNYFDPLQLIRDAQPKGGSDVANRDQVNTIYKAVLFRDGDPGGLANYTGKDANIIVSEMLNSAERKALEGRINAANKTIQDLQTALANEQAKPPREVVKEVEKVVTQYVDRPVEVIVEVEKPVDEKEVVTNWLKRLWNSLFNKKG